MGFHHSSQLEVTEPYVDGFFEVAARVWAEQDSEPAQEFMVLGYPRFHISAERMALADAWLAQEGHPASLRRLVAEGRDAVVRAVTARACDAAAA